MRCPGPNVPPPPIVLRQTHVQKYNIMGRNDRRMRSAPADYSMHAIHYNVHILLMTIHHQSTHPAPCKTCCHRPICSREIRSILGTCRNAVKAGKISATEGGSQEWLKDQVKRGNAFKSKRSCPLVLNGPQQRSFSSPAFWVRAMLRYRDALFAKNFVWFRGSHRF